MTRSEAAKAREARKRQPGGYYDMTPEEKRAYHRQKQRESRARASAEAKLKKLGLSD